VTLPVPPVDLAVCHPSQLAAHRILARPGAPHVTDGGIDPNQTPPPQGLDDTSVTSNIDVRKVIGADGKVS
jgi:hypothetical protein